MLTSTSFVCVCISEVGASCDRSKTSILAQLARQEMEHDVHHHHHQQQLQQQQAMEMELPPGFRFHPTDEELITHYLAMKTANPRFVARAVGVADLNKCEPWDLPCKS